MTQSSLFKLLFTAGGVPKGRGQRQATPLLLISVLSVCTFTSEVQLTLQNMNSVAVQDDDDSTQILLFFCQIKSSR